MQAVFFQPSCLMSCHTRHDEPIENRIQRRPSDGQDRERTEAGDLAGVIVVNLPMEQTYRAINSNRAAPDHRRHGHGGPGDGRLGHDRPVLDYHAVEMGSRGVRAFPLFALRHNPNSSDPRVRSKGTDSCPYRSFKHLLGETSLERKCRFIFGLGILLLVSRQLLLVRAEDREPGAQADDPDGPDARQPGTAEHPLQVAGEREFRLDPRRPFERPEAARRFSPTTRPGSSNRTHPRMRRNRPTNSRARPSRDSSSPPSPAASARVASRWTRFRRSPTDRRPGPSGSRTARKSSSTSRRSSSSRTA